MRVQVISKESIKPSSPTAQNLKIFKLCLLDQLIPAPFAPIVLFYPCCNGVSSRPSVQEKLLVLKQSLSETLTLFYPLAGVIRDDLSIDCNDEGAYFAVSDVNSSLSEFLSNLDVQILNKFLPCEPSFSESSTGARVTNVQVNVFKCGGIAIGLCISHKILDGAALNTFLTSWVGSACRSDKVVRPDFIASSLFPTDELWLRDSSMVMWGSLFKKGECTTRRFVFDHKAIAKLKANATSSNLQQPTRVEVVSAFLWKCAMAATEKNCGANRPSILTHVVNLRKRNVPPLSDRSIGNLIWIASAKCSGENDEQLGFQDLVDQVRKGISKINGDFLKKIRGDQVCSVMCKTLKEVGNFCSKEEVDSFAFTSWCNFGFYDADFGWGKPVWVSSVTPNGAVFMNLIVLMDTRCGEGIEAWVTLDEQEMKFLEHDLDLLSLASFDPNPVFY